MTTKPALEQIGATIAANDVVLFMKGTPEVPQYGFSAAVTKILSQLGVPFPPVNVLGRLKGCQCGPLRPPFVNVMVWTPLRARGKQYAA